MVINEVTVAQNLVATFGTAFKMTTDNTPGAKLGHERLKTLQIVDPNLGIVVGQRLIRNLISITVKHHDQIQTWTLTFHEVQQQWNQWSGIANWLQRR